MNPAEVNILKRFFKARIDKVKRDNIISFSYHKCADCGKNIINKTYFYYNSNSKLCLYHPNINNNDTIYIYSESPKHIIGMPIRRSFNNSNCARAALSGNNKCTYKLNDTSILQSISNLYKLCS